MTIITANRPALRLAPLALAAMLLSAECHAQWKIAPGIDVRETFSDNLGLQSDERAHSGFVGEVAPRITVSTNGPRLKLTADAQWRAYAYDDKRVPDLRNSDRRYNANAQAMLVDQLLYVDAAASRSRQAVSGFGPLSGYSYSSRNNTEISTWRVSPYVRHRFGASTLMTARFTRDAVEGGGGYGYGDSLASTTSIDLANNAATTTLGWNLAYNRQDLHMSQAGTGIAFGDSSSQTGTAGLRWNLIPRFGLTATVGYDDYDYPALGQRTSGRSWTGGFVWTPSARTNLQASFGHRYFGKTGSLAFSHRMRRSVWTLDYSDQITTTRSQFTLPAAFDTAAMLDSLFAATYPDPVQRQQAIQAYIAAAGLPPSLTDSINYLTNRYIRVKRLQGSVAFRGARSDLLLTVFSDQRNALSMQETDSTLLLGQLSSLNDNTRQRGASANFNYRLSPRTQALARLTGSRIQSLTTGVVNNNREVALGLNHRLGVYTRASLDLRHTSGRLDLVNTGNYHENAVVATLSVQY